MAGSPYTQYLEESVNLSTENQSFSFDFSPTSSDPANKLKFFVGLEAACVYIDSVVYKEIDITGISLADETPFVYIYPNPVTHGKVFVVSKSGDLIDRIELIDLQGRLILSTRPRNSRVEVELPSLASGIYFLKINSEQALLSKIVIL